MIYIEVLLPIFSPGKDFLLQVNYVVIKNKKLRKNTFLCIISYNL